MPEGLEVDIWCAAAQVLCGRRIVDLDVAPGQWDGPAAPDLAGATVLAVERRAKTLVLCTTAGWLGLHAGMSGRLAVDGVMPIPALVYGPAGSRPAWERILLRTDDGGGITVVDPRRWARAAWGGDGPEPQGRLFGPFGPDVLGISAADLGAALAGRRGALKAVLLDQRVLAGLGNLCADEMLWQAGLDPRRPAGGLRPEEVQALARAMRRSLPVMRAAGGSHTGRLSPALRRPGAACPRDGAPVEVGRIGGRTTVWCRAHQV